jgi:hypothetical protein
MKAKCRKLALARSRQKDAVSTAAIKINYLELP